MKLSESYKPQSESKNLRTQILGVLLTTLIACSPESDALAKEKQKGREVFVERVTDGDTITVRPNKDNGKRERIRLKGLDCPESRREICKNRRYNKRKCYEQLSKGKEATKVAKSLLIIGQRVALISALKNGDLELDKFGRTLAYVEMANGKDFGLTMIEKGLCRNYRRFKHPMKGKYKDAQKEAKRRRR